MRTGMKTLIINADDYGLCDSVNDGIIECYREGLVSDFSFIINPDYLDQSVKKLKSENITDFGIHFNITMGISKFGKARGLTDSQGRFLSTGNLFLKWVKGSLNTEAIYLELKSQFEYLVSCGFNITHFDSHQNVHLIPDIFILFEKIKKEFQLKNIPIRLPAERIRLFHKYKLSNLRRMIILNTLSFISKRKIKELDFIKTIGGDFFNNSNPDKVFKDVIANMKNDGTVYEIAVHPGYPSQDILKYDTYSEQRETELSFLKRFSKSELEPDLRITDFKGLFNKP
jgi:predicted glycoside hydrolase/deacetylase ChbG (UPF0249 family)